MQKTTRTYVILIAILVIIFGGSFAWYGLKLFFIKHYFATFQPPPVAVSTTAATERTWQPTLNAVGSLTAVNGVDVTTQVNGQIVAINFQSGQMVAQGQSLVQLDDSLDQQALQNNLAQLKLAKINFESQSQIYAQHLGKKSDYDTAQANLVQAQVNLASSQLNISYKNIKAPFAGKIGIRNINVGQFVTAGQALVSLQSMDPLYVDFQLPEQFLPQVKVGEAVLLTFDAYPGRTFNGAVTALDSKVDVNTRTIAVRATIPNKTFELYPGLFTSIQVLLPQQLNRVTVPQTAITYSLYGDTVYVVTQQGLDKDKKPILVATQRFVTLGDRRDNEVQVLKGLLPNEKVVTAGQLKLHNGSTVTINNTVQLQ